MHRETVHLGLPGRSALRYVSRLARERVVIERSGAVAQLGERLTGSQEVEGSTPFGSTKSFAVLFVRSRPQADAPPMRETLSEPMRAPRLAVLALLAPLVVAMGGRGSGPMLPVRTIASGGGAGTGSSPAVWLVRSVEDLAAVMSARVPGFALPPEPAQPAIDYAREVVVGVALGERRTGGFTVEIVGATRRGNTLEVTVRETKPAPGAMTIQVLTYPWTLAAITLEGAIDRVVAKDDSGRELPSIETSTGPATR